MIYSTEKAIGKIDCDIDNVLEKIKNFKLITQNSISSTLDPSKQQNEGEEIMKNIRRRTNGKYEVRLYISKQRVSRYAKNQRDAIRILRELKKMKSKIESQTEQYVQTLPDFANEWFQTYKINELSPKSQENYRNILKNYIPKINKPIQLITTSDLQQQINSMPPTRTREVFVQVLRQVFKKAKELQIVNYNPAEFITKGKIERTKREWLTLEEQAKLLDWIKNNDGIISLAMLTYLLVGCRPNEIQTIKKSKIKNNFLFIDGTKTKNATRWVKISDHFQNILQSQENEFIFRFGYKRFSEKVRNVFKSLNIDKTIYSFRHTFATNLMYLGCKDRERQSYMGHASIDVTNDVYTDFDPTIKKEDILNLYKDLYPDF